MDKAMLPHSLRTYVQEVGVQAVDNIAARSAEATQTTSEGVRSLVDNWRQRSDDEKKEFVDKLALAVLEIAAATAVVPVGVKQGKKAVKSVRKFIKRRAKALKKSKKKFKDDAKKKEKTRKEEKNKPKKKAKKKKN